MPRGVYQHRSRLPEDRFWAKVRRGAADECWPWLGAIRNRRGYGHLSISRKASLYAHRFSRQIHYGPIPKGSSVLHRCDNPRCVNPAHLFLGSHIDNMRDMVAKERQQRGSRNGHARLTESLVVEIRELRRAGISIAELGSNFRVSLPLISMICSGKRWKHVGQEG